MRPRGAIAVLKQRIEELELKSVGGQGKPRPDGRMRGTAQLEVAGVREEDQMLPPPLHRAMDGVGCTGRFGEPHDHGGSRSWGVTPRAMIH